MENSELLDHINILNPRSSSSGLIDSKLLENIVNREPSFQPQEMQNSASSNDMNINDIGINRQMIEQVMQQMGIPSLQSTSQKRRVPNPTKQQLGGGVNGNNPPINHPINPQPHIQPNPQDGQVIQSSSDISMSKNNMFALYGYSIPNTTLYLILILVLIGVAIYMMSGEKKKKNKATDNDENNNLEKNN